MLLLDLSLNRNRNSPPAQGRVGAFWWGQGGGHWKLGAGGKGQRGNVHHECHDSVCLCEQSEPSGVIKVLSSK